ncbi:MAG: FG-GAP repeat protein [Bacteroidota bacterium]
MKKTLIAIACMAVSHMMLFGQTGSIGIGTPPAPSAMLHVQSTSKGLLIPRMTTAQRKAINNPETGLLVFDTDKNTIYMYDALKWLPFVYAQNEESLPTRIVRPASNIDGQDEFGFSADISGNHAIVGAPDMDPSASTTGNEDYGGVQFFDKLNGYWQTNMTVLQPNPNTGAKFGYSVSIDGDIAVIGAPFANVSTSTDEGKAYVYKRNTTTNNWVLVTELTGSSASADDHFGYSVAISGNLIVIGAPDDDVVINGNTHANQGSAYVFAFNGTSWIQRAKLYTDDGLAGDVFGTSVDIEDKTTGDFIIVGAPGRNIGANADEGAAYMYVSLNDPVNWLLSGAELTLSIGAANDKFGTCVAVKDGKFAVMAPYHSGAAYAAVYDAGHDEIQRIGLGIAATAPHGYSIAFNGSELAIGMNNRTVDGLADAGYVIIYNIDNGLLLFKHIYDPTPVTGGDFGYAVALSGYDLISTTFGSREAHFIHIE